MLTVIVTGVIGSGKSAVCAILSSRGIPVYDADSRTKSLYETVPGLVQRLELSLGAKFSMPDGRLDRKALAALLFSNTVAREKLEGIVYPLVKEDFLGWRNEQVGAPFVVLESAVILSKPLFSGIADGVVAVAAPQEKRLSRLIRRGVSLQEAQRRLAAQQQDFSAAGAVIQNAGTKEELSREVERVFFGKNSYICKLEK